MLYHYVRIYLSVLQNVNIELAAYNWGVQRLASLVTGKSSKWKEKVQRCFQICAKPLAKLSGPILFKSSSVSKPHVVADARTFE